MDGKIGKIHAEALNQKNVGGLLDKVAGGCLIIEQAGDMEKKTVSELSGLLDADESGLFVILEDTSKGIKRLFAQNETFAKNSVNRSQFRFLQMMSWSRLRALIPENLDTKLTTWRSGIV